MADITFTIERGNETFVLDVEYLVAPRIPARGPSWGSPGDPEEGGEITDMTVTWHGQPFELTAKETAAIEQHIYETHDYSDHGFDGCDGFVDDMTGWD